jgi:acyl-CoA synthetase (AMP-forming)/AMP-acid ligase II
MNTPDTAALSIARGPTLAGEAQLGSKTLPGFLREVCDANSDREALAFRMGDAQPIRITYSEVWRQSMRIARALVASGVGKDTRVGLLATNRPDWVVAMFGITLAGGTCVALSSFSTAIELEQQLRLADVAVLLFERSVPSRDFAADLLALCPELRSCTAGGLQAPRLPYLRLVVQFDGQSDVSGIATLPAFLERAAGASEELVGAIAQEIAPADLALVFFSSGSTGRPKGVMQSHRAAAIQSWRWARILATDHDVRTWTANGLFWSGNFCMALGATFAAGGCLVLQRYFVPGEALQLMAAEKVNMPLAWPHQLARLTADPVYPQVNLSALHYVGENSPLRRHPTVATSWDEPMSAYGSTETLTLSAAHPSGTAREISAGNHGFPLPGNIIRIVDPPSGMLLPKGQLGEIAVKGPTLMLGYLKMTPEEAFDEDGFFRTGDGGYIDDLGRLHWHGRINDIIKTGGANVSPLEIDVVLAEYPGVKVAQTVGVPHDTLGEMVVACVVGEAGVVLQEGSIREFVGRRLSSYKVPRRVLFLQESELSFTGTNKVKTDALRALAAGKLAAQTT